MNLYCKSIL